MRKSNKLLVGGFLSVLLLITAVHITLYAKYKNGDYTVYHEDDDLTTQAMQSFPSILFVSVQNVPNAAVRFSEVAEVEKREDEDIEYVRKGDTLVITGKKKQSGFGHRAMMHVPFNATLFVSNSTLSFQNSRKAIANNPVIHLDKSQAFFAGDNDGLQFGNLKLIASNNSNAAFQNNTEVSQLEVQLLNSSLDCSDGNFNQLSITTDSSSRLTLQTKHFLKANIKTSQ